MDFPPKKDTQIVLLFWCLILFIIAMGLFILSDINTQAAILIAAGIIIVGIGLYLLMAFLTYRVEEKTLHVRQWPLRWKIPIENIIKVYPSKGANRFFGSRPALSTDLIEIEYKAPGGINNNLQIAPADKNAFLAHLTQIDPALQQMDDGLSLQRA